MSLHVIAFIMYLLFATAVCADTNSTNSPFADYIDKKQETYSKKVITIFDSVDEGISSWFGDADSNLTCDEKEEELVDTFFKEDENAMDKFFKSDKYIDETIRSFLRIRLGSLFQSKESTIFSYKISARLPLSKTKKRFNLFIDNIEKNYFDATTTDNTDNKSTPEVGVNYFAKEFHGIESKYSIGIRGLSAFARARYSKAFKAGEWIIQPTQQFQYSTKYSFEEETNLYFDKTLYWSSLFRTTLHRKTKIDQPGMDYRLAFSYYFTPKKNSGLSLSQSFWGNTKYTCIVEPEQYGGISDYVTAFTWRQTLWRKWIAYEVQPAISFHRQYDYETNYMLRFNLDFYFGSF